MSKKSSDQGTVVHWNYDGGYGFIRPDMGGGRDVFMHVSALNGDELRIGDKVSYEISTDAKSGKPCAINLELIDAPSDGPVTFGSDQPWID